MPQVHLEQPEFIYGGRRPFTKSKWRMQKFKETRDSSRKKDQKELDKVVFNMTWLKEVLNI